MFQIELNEEQPFRLACLGDSITRAHWIHPNFREILNDVLERQYDNSLIKVLDCARDGEQASEGLVRLEHDVFAFRPFLCTVMYGHNERDFGTDVSTYRQVLLTVIGKLHEAKVLPILMTFNKPNRQDLVDKSLPYLETIREIAVSLGLRLVDIWHAFEQEDLDSLYTIRWGYPNEIQGRKADEPDPVHPNAQGHWIMARELLKLFEIDLDEAETSYAAVRQ